MFCRGLLKGHFCKTFVKISSEIAMNANFHFSHCKSMVTPELFDWNKKTKNKEKKKKKKKKRPIDAICEIW